MTMYDTENLKDGKLTIRELMNMDIDWHPPGQRDTQASTPEKEVSYVVEIMNNGYLYKMALAEVYDDAGEFTGEYRVIDGSHRNDAMEKFKSGQIPWTSPDGDVLVWGQLSKAQKAQFLDYDKIDIVVYKNLTEEEEGMVFRKLNDGSSVTEEEFLNSFNIEIRDIIRVIVRGGRSGVRSEVLRRLGRHSQHKLFEAMDRGDWMDPGQITRHRNDLIAIKILAIFFKKAFDNKTIYDFTQDRKFYSSMYVGPNTTAGLWSKFSDKNPDARDKCVMDCLKFMDTVYDFLRKAPNGLKSFKSKNEFEGIVNHMIGLEIMFGGKRKVRNIISDPAKYTSSWLAAHETLKPNISKGVKSDYGFLIGRKQGWEWRMKFDYIMKYVMENGGLESMSIRPKKDRKRDFSQSDKNIAWNFQEGRCGHCNDELTWDNMHAHHRPIPHEDGGPTVPENCELLHVDCHRKQHSSGDVIGLVATNA